MKTSLYNNDGTLSIEAQSLLSPKPSDMSMGDWIKAQRQFRSQLSEEEFKKFNKLKAAIKSVEYRTRHPEKLFTQRRNWRHANKEKRKIYDKNYSTKHKEKIAKRRRIYYKRIGWGPKDKIRNAVRVAFKRIGKNKPANTLELLGCSWEEAKAHIESLWQEGMTWENHGRYGWHIDHIRPVNSFEDHELDQMNHISNLQPLWAKDNLSKSDKW